MPGAAAGRRGGALERAPTRAAALLMALAVACGPAAAAGRTPLGLRGAAFAPLRPLPRLPGRLDQGSSPRPPPGVGRLHMRPDQVQGGQGMGWFASKVFHAAKKSIQNIASPKHTVPEHTAPPADNVCTGTDCLQGALKDHKYAQVDPSHVDIDYSHMLGDGTYGEVYEGVLTQGPLAGMRIVAKCAKDWEGSMTGPDDTDTLSATGLNRRVENFARLSTADRESADLAYRYLEVEAYMNDLMTQQCPYAGAPYLGMSVIKNRRWLIWQHLGDDTLEDVLRQCDLSFSLVPLARALGVENFRDNDRTSLHILVNVLARQLLECCRALEEAGVAHRDIKPYNVLCYDGRLLLIDFGSAAAMGVTERVGYDWHKSPCDPRYAPPEQFIDEKEWAKYDLYCVGLILVRVLFPPLWCGEHFDEFADSYHESNYDLDNWLSRIIALDSALARKQSGKQSHLGEPLDSQYVSMAEDSCVVNPMGTRLNMCSMKPGLEVLNNKFTGICWSTLRSMLAMDPVIRMSNRQVIQLIKDASLVR